MVGSNRAHHITGAGTGSRLNFSKHALSIANGFKVGKPEGQSTGSYVTLVPVVAQKRFPRKIDRAAFD
jgi:hypothetical protein